MLFLKQLLLPLLQHLFRYPHVLYVTILFKPLSEQYGFITKDITVTVTIHVNAEHWEVNHRRKISNCKSLLYNTMKMQRKRVNSLVTELMVNTANIILLEQTINNSVALVSERTIPTLVGEVCTKFRGLRVSHGQGDGSLWPYSRVSRPVLEQTAQS
jgi:hypothetical protein